MVLVKSHCITPLSASRKGVSICTAPLDTKCSSIVFISFVPHLAIIFFMYSTCCYFAIVGLCSTFYSVPSHPAGKFLFLFFSYQSLPRYLHYKARWKVLYSVKSSQVWILCFLAVLYIIFHWHNTFKRDLSTSLCSLFFSSIPKMTMKDH